MNKDVIEDIIEWDIINWSRALEYIDNCFAGYDFSDKTILCVGERNGGLSLYFSYVKKARKVICTDIDNDFGRAKTLHKKYCLSNIEYRELDITKENLGGLCDVVAFKSVLGATGYNHNYEGINNAISNCLCSLRKGGVLCFLENLKGTKLHSFFRIKMSSPNSFRRKWHYFTLEEIENLLNECDCVNIETYGFLGCFGIGGGMRGLLGKIDKKFDCGVKKGSRYIASVFTVK